MAHRLCIKANAEQHLKISDRKRNQRSKSRKGIQFYIYNIKPVLRKKHFGWISIVLSDNYKTAVGVASIMKYQSIFWFHLLTLPMCLSKFGKENAYWNIGSSEPWWNSQKGDLTTMSSEYQISWSHGIHRTFIMHLEDIAYADDVRFFGANHFAIQVKFKTLRTILNKVEKLDFW